MSPLASGSADRLPRSSHRDATGAPGPHEAHDPASAGCLGHNGAAARQAPSWELPVPADPFPRIVALGGGTGLPVLLQGLKAVLFPLGSVPRERPADRDRLTAIVTVADDGGSSGRLRRTYRVLAPGDIRNCLLALSDGEPPIAALFKFRFRGDGEVGGHSLGNLILTALSQLEGDFPDAVERASEMLAIRGRILPSTGDDVTLLAEFADGSWVSGESRIAGVRRPIRRVCLEPENARAVSRAVQAIAASDLVVVGPGSLYTSLLPTLLVQGIADAIARSRARVVLVMNLMTEPGETDGHTAADFVRAIRRHAPRLPIHDVLVNDAPIHPEVLEVYARQGSVPIRSDLEALAALGCRPVERELLGTDSLARHDPGKLARAVVALALEKTA